MNKITGKKQVFWFFLAIIWALFALACGPQVSKKKPEKKPTAPAAKAPKVKKSPVTKSKKPQKVEKPAPVFQPQAAITMANGKVYEVADFAFYSNHRRFSGAMYYPTSGTIKWPLYLKQGPTWKKFDFARVKSLTTAKRKYYSDMIPTDLLTTDNKKFRGLLPIDAFDKLWYKQGFVHLTGTSEVLGRSGVFKTPIDYVSSFERLDAAEGQPKFKIIHGRKEKKESIITTPQLKIIQTKTTPKYLDVYKLKTTIPVTVNNTEIKIKPGEIESVTVPRRSNEPFTVKMRQGETAKMKLPPKIFGKLENGDILFTYFFEKGKPTVKKIQIMAKPTLFTY
jgi:hypothetical protein